jgi:hypothetical protein
MNKKNRTPKKEPKFRFVVSEPPFKIDPLDKGYLEKLESANKTLGKIMDANNEHQKNDPWARVKIGELPSSYDPFAKGLMEKLAHANKVGLGEIMEEDEDDYQPKSKASKPSQKTKRSNHSKAVRNSAAVRTKGK